MFKCNNARNLEGGKKGGKEVMGLTFLSKTIVSKGKTQVGKMLRCEGRPKDDSN